MNHYLYLFYYYLEVFISLNLKMRAYFLYDQENNIAYSTLPPKIKFTVGSCSLYILIEWLHEL